MESPAATMSPTRLKATTTSSETEDINSVHARVEAQYEELVMDTTVFLSPMAVSKLLLLLKLLRQSMDTFLSLPSRDQEARAYQLLNACKLVEHYCQPLIWYSCSKYVLDTMVYTILCMESVINLCTTRHLTLRMKLYATAFYAALAQNKCDEAENIFLRCTKEVSNLREREHLDPPVPPPTLEALQKAQEDLGVFKFVLNHFRDPDRLDFVKGCVPPTDSSVAPLGYAERCVCEYIRVHLFASGNKNEVYMKRGQSLTKALPALVSSGGLGVRTACEIAYLLLFDSYIEQDQRAQVFVHLHTVYATCMEAQSEHEEEFVHKLALLCEVYEFTYNHVDFFAKDSQDRVKQFLTRLEESIYTNYAHRNPSLLIFLGMEVFKKCVYGPINSFLQQRDQPKREQEDRLHAFADALNAVLQCIDRVVYYDPVLYVGLCVLQANIYIHLEEFRLATSVCKYALYLVDIVRELKIDIRLHVPEEIRDIFSVQHMSVSSIYSLSDWFDSMKRLGANAYAGYGIYGMYNAIHIHDEALQELHMDVYICYYRSELRYYRNYLVDKDAHKARAHQAELKKGEKKEPAPAPTTPKPVDTWPIVTSLLHNNHRNNYANCCLYLEMAKCESQEHHSAQIRKYLDAALDCAKKASDAEHLLANSFADVFIHKEAFTYPVMLARSHRYVYLLPTQTSAVKGVTHYSIFGKEYGAGTDVSIYSNLLRGCEKKVNPIDLQAFYARNRVGQNTAGMQVDMEQVNLSSKYLYNNLVRMGPLIPGEEYIFSTAACNGKDSVIKLSPRTPTVLVAHPLNVHQLYMLVMQTYIFVNNHQSLTMGMSTIPSTYGMDPLAAAITQAGPSPSVTSPQVSLKNNAFLSKVFQEHLFRGYFLTPPRIERLTLTSGDTLNVISSTPRSSPQLDYHTMFMQSAQDTSAFLHTLVLYVDSTFAQHYLGSSLFFNHTEASEMSLLTLVHYATVCLQACASIYVPTVLFKCVLLLHNVLQEVCRFDLPALAIHIQPACVSAVLALRGVSTELWTEDVHIAYVFLLAAVVQLATASQALSPVLPLLQSVYVTPPPLHSLSARVLQRLSALYLVCDQRLGPAVRQPFQQSIKQILSTHAAAVVGAGEDASALPFWKQHAIHRFAAVYTLEEEVAVTGSQGTALLCDQVLATAPQHYSDYLELLVHTGRVVRNRVPIPTAATAVVTPAVPAAGAGWVLERELVCIENVRALMRRMPIVKEYLHPDLHDLLVDHADKINKDAPMLLAMSELAGHLAGLKNQAAAPAAGGKDTKAAGKGKEPAAPVAVVPDEVVNPYAAPYAHSTEEIRRQCAAIADLMVVLTPSVAPNSLLPASLDGPYRRTAVDAFESVSKPMDATNEGTVEAPATPLGSERLTAEAVAHMTQLCLAALCYAKADQLKAATNALVLLQHFITAHYISLDMLHNQHPELLPLSYSMWVQLVECLCRRTLVSVQMHAAVHVYAFLEPILRDHTVTFETYTACSAEEVRGKIDVYELREWQEMLLLLREPVMWWLQFIYKAKDHIQYETVVPRALSLNLAFALFTDHRKEVADDLLPFVTDMQHVVLFRYEQQRNAANDALTKFIDDYNAAQAKVRKRKLKINRTEKDEDEIAFDEAKHALESKIADEELLVGIRKAALLNVAAITEGLNDETNKHTVLFYKLKVRLCDLFARINNANRTGEATEMRHAAETFGEEGSHKSTKTAKTAKSTLPNYAFVPTAFVSSVERIRRDYDRVITLLREHKERELLIDACADMCSLSILLQDFTKLRVYIQDMIDGYFSSYNSISQFREVLATYTTIRTSITEQRLLGSVFKIVIACGHYIRYCYHTTQPSLRDSHDRSSALGSRPQDVLASSLHKEDLVNITRYALFASELLMTLFQDSLVHPHTMAGLSGYVCNYLGSTPNLLRFLHIDLHLLYQALGDCAEVLSAYTQQHLYCLPLLVVREMVASQYLHSVRATLQTRMLRVHVCIQLENIAESIALLSSTPRLLLRVQSHGDAMVSVRRQTSHLYATNPASPLYTYDRSAAGLFFDQAHMFSNSAPPNAASPGVVAASVPAAPPAKGKDAKEPPPAAPAQAPGDTRFSNPLSLEFVASYPTQLEQFLTTSNYSALFKLRVPEAMLTPAQLQTYTAKVKAIEEAQLQAQQAPAKGAPAKGKGVIAEPVPVNKEDFLPIVQIFDRFDVCYVHYLCALLLFKVTHTHSSIHSALYKQQQMDKHADTVASLLEKSKGLLFSSTKSDWESVEDVERSRLFPAHGDEGVTQGPGTADALPSLPTEGFLHVLCTSSRALMLFNWLTNLDLDLLLDKRNYRTALSLIVQTTRLLHHPHIEHALTVKKHFVMVCQYFHAYKQLATICMDQCRPKDALLTCRRMIALAGSVGSHVHAAHFEFVAALALHSQGNVAEALVHCNNCLMTCEMHHLQAQLYLQAKMLKTRLLIAAAQFTLPLQPAGQAQSQVRGGHHGAGASPTSRKTEVVRNFFLAYLEAKDAYYVSMQLCALHGLVPPDHNLNLSQTATATAAPATATAPDGTVYPTLAMGRKNHVVPPVRSLLSELHNSDPDPYRHEHHILIHANGHGEVAVEKEIFIDGDRSVPVTNDAQWSAQHSKALRLGPLDMEPLTCPPHHLVNLYSSYALISAVAHVQLLALLKELHAGHVFRDFRLYADDLAAIFTQLQQRQMQDAHGKHNFSLYLHKEQLYRQFQRGEFDYKYVLEALDVLDAGGQVDLSLDKIMRDLLILAEQTLKSFRLYVHVPAYLRAQGLTLVAYARLQHSLASLRTATRDPTRSATHLLGAQHDVPVDVCLGPLLFSMHHVTVQHPGAGYLYPTMRDACILLTEALLHPGISFTAPIYAYGDAFKDLAATLTAALDPLLRGKLAIFYQQLACKLHAMHVQATTQFVAQPEAPLGPESPAAKLLLSVYNASVSGNKLPVPEDPQAAAAAAAASGADKSKDKAKKPDAKAGAGGAAGGGASLTTRDAVQCLAGVLRCADLVVGLPGCSSVLSPAHVLAQDLHTFMLEDTQYKQAYVLQQSPFCTAQTAVAVAMNQVTTLWTLQAKPGDVSAHTREGSGGFCGLYSHVQCAFVLGDVSAQSVAVAAPAKGAKPVAGDAAALGGTSLEPAIKRICPQRRHVNQLVHALRRLALELQEQQGGGGAISAALLSRCARSIVAIYTLVRFDVEAFTETQIMSSDLLGEEVCSLAEGKAKICVEDAERGKVFVVITITGAKWIALSDLFTAERSVALVDPEVCQLLRQALGCAKLVKL